MGDGDRWRKEDEAEVLQPQQPAQSCVCRVEKRGEAL